MKTNEIQNLLNSPEPVLVAIKAPARKWGSADKAYLIGCGWSNSRTRWRESFHNSGNGIAIAKEEYYGAERYWVRAVVPASNIVGKWEDYEQEARIEEQKKVDAGRRALEREQKNAQLRKEIIAKMETIKAGGSAELTQEQVRFIETKLGY